MLLIDVDHSCALHFFVQVVIVHGVVTIFKTQELANEGQTNEYLSVSVKKINKDAQAVEDSCHSEDTITGAWCVKQTIDTQLFVIIDFIPLVVS